MNKVWWSVGVSWLIWFWSWHILCRHLCPSPLGLLWVFYHGQQLSRSRHPTENNRSFCLAGTPHTACCLHVQPYKSSALKHILHWTRAFESTLPPLLLVWICPLWCPEQCSTPWCRPKKVKRPPRVETANTNIKRFSLQTWGYMS